MDCQLSFYFLNFLFFSLFLGTLTGHLVLHKMTNYNRSVWENPEDFCERL